MSAAVLEGRGLAKRYRRRQVVRGVDLLVNRGEIVGLLGPNGAGKTTTFYMLVGVVRPDDGCVLLDGEDVTAWPMYRRARAGLAYLPQEGSVFRGLTVEQNLLLPLEVNGVPRLERRERVERLLEQFDIGKIRTTLGRRLSGGERRRVEMARALTLSPSFLLLDEPFLGVDPITISEMKGMLARLRESGIGVLLTDHNVYDALPVCDRAYVMHEGRILVHGDARSVAEHPDARRFYLGEDFVFRGERA